MRYAELVPGQVTLRSGEIPERPPGWARIKVLACGVCGTDLHMLHGMVMPPGAQYPVRPGHEVTGVVLETDEGAPVGAGDRVVLHPLDPCRTCRACRAGQDQRCSDAKILGIHHAGGLAEQVVWPADRMLSIGPLDPVLAAVLADAFATAYHAVDLADLPVGGSLCVIGAGGVGTQSLMIARALDPSVEVAAVVRSEASAARLRESGVDAQCGIDAAVEGFRSQRRSFDVVIDFSGSASAPARAVRLLRRGGRCILGSVVDEPLDLGQSSLFVTRELQVRAVYTSSLSDLAAVIELASSGQLDLGAAVSHRLPLARADEAIDLVAERPPGLVRVVVEA